jgi:hypothetical protein
MQPNLTAPERPIIDLVLREELDTEERLVNQRSESLQLQVLIGVGAILPVIFLMDWTLQGREFWRALGLVIAVGVIYGLLFALYSWRSSLRESRRDVAKRIDRIYAGDPSVVLPPPKGATHRVFCAVQITQRSALAGALYVRPGGLTFQPHRLEAPWWSPTLSKVLAPLSMEPAAAVTLHVGVLNRGWLSEKLFPRPVLVLIVNCPDGPVIFQTGPALMLRDRLQQCVDNLRRDEHTSYRAVEAS